MERGSGFVNVLYELKILQWRFAAIMQSGCRANKRFGIIDGENLSASSVMVRQNFATSEKLFGKRRAQQWELTTDPETLPKNGTWYVMTHIPNLKYHQVGNLYGLRNWVEYLKQSKNELGWADFRMTSYAQIERWWEIVMSAYLLVSLHTSCINRNCNPHNLLLNPKQLLSNSCNTQTGIKPVAGNRC